MHDELERIRRSEMEYCMEHPAYFIENYCQIEDKDTPGVAVPFALWDGQREALQELAAHKLNIILKARQLGITWLVLAYAVHLLLKTPGATVIAISRTEEEAKELVRRVGFLLEHMGELVSPVPAPGRLTFQRTALSVTIEGEGLPRIFRAFPSGPSAARSFTANLIILDEWAFQQYAEEIWTSGFPTVNRPGGGQVIGLSTMRLGTLFARLWQEGDAFHRIFLPWDTDPRRDGEWYEKTRRVLGEAVYSEYPATPEEALLAPVGAFFDEFRRDVHVSEPFAIPADWRRYQALDYGLDMLAGVWAAFDNEGNAYVYREVYESGLPIAQAARAILEAEEPGEDIYTRYAPPDIFGRSQESGRPRSDIFAENGMILDKSSNDREGGWANLKDWLEVFLDEEGKPTARLKIFKNCRNLLRTLPAIPRDKKRPNDCATDPHELTHAPDALRYLFCMRPKAGKREADKRTEIFYQEVESFLDYGV